MRRKTVSIILINLYNMFDDEPMTAKVIGTNEGDVEFTRSWWWFNDAGSVNNGVSNTGWSR